MLYKKPCCGVTFTDALSNHCTSFPPSEFLSENKKDETNSGVRLVMLPDNGNICSDAWHGRYGRHGRHGRFAAPHDEPRWWRRRNDGNADDVVLDARWRRGTWWGRWDEQHDAADDGYAGRRRWGDVPAPDDDDAEWWTQWNVKQPNGDDVFGAGRRRRHIQDAAADDASVTSVKRWWGRPRRPHRRRWRNGGRHDPLVNVQCYGRLKQNPVTPPSPRPPRPLQQNPTYPLHTSIPPPSPRACLQATSDQCPTGGHVIAVKSLTRVNVQLEVRLQVLLFNKTRITTAVSSLSSNFV